jgi:hypothetical protein
VLKKRRIEMKKATKTVSKRSKQATTPDSEVKEMELRGHTCTLTHFTHEPWLALPTFQTMLRLSRECGFLNVENITIQVSATFSGYKGDASPERLEQRLEEDWTGFHCTVMPFYTNKRREDEDNESLENALEQG